MASNYIVLRHSPDWRNFDLEDSRTFCRIQGLPEDTVIRFADCWRKTFALDFREFRHEIKQITVKAIAEHGDCRLWKMDDFDSAPVDADDMFLFMDDDDWLAPNLFEVLRSHETQDGDFLWGSVYFGNLQPFMWAADPRLNAATEQDGACGLRKRPANDFVYTNNYCITGRTFQRLGVKAIFEHYEAQNALSAGLFSPRNITSYLSCENKHPCSSMWIFAQLSQGSVERDHLHETVGNYRQALAEAELDADTQWLAPYLAHAEAIVRRTLSSDR